MPRPRSLAFLTLVALAGCSPGAEPGRQVEALRQELRTGDSRARLRALQTLARLGQAAQSAVPEVVAQLQQTRLRHAATRVLAGLDATVVVPALIQAMLEPELRPHARRVLGLLERAAIPGLCAALRTLDAEPAAVAIDWLCEIGLEAVPAMLDLSTDPRAGPRALVVLERMGFWALPAILDHLARCPVAVRRSALPATRKYGWMLGRAQDFFLLALADSSEQTREMAAVALAVVGMPAVPALVRGLAVPGIAAGCEHALLAIGAAAHPALRAARGEASSVVLAAIDRILSSP